MLMPLETCTVKVAAVSLPTMPWTLVTRSFARSVSTRPASHGAQRTWAASPGTTGCTA